MERAMHERFIDKEHRSMKKSFFFRVSFVSYVFLNTFWENTQTILAHRAYSFYTKWRIYVWK